MRFPKMRRSHECLSRSRLGSFFSLERARSFCSLNRENRLKTSPHSDSQLRLFLPLIALRPLSAAFGRRPRVNAREHTDAERLHAFMQMKMLTSDTVLSAPAAFFFRSPRKENLVRRCLPVLGSTSSKARGFRTRTILERNIKKREEFFSLPPWRKCLFIRFFPQPPEREDAKGRRRENNISGGDVTTVY
jgi:hypothetical protein